MSKRSGRPTVRTPGRAKIICDSLARGLPYVHCCSIVGISFETFSKWRGSDEKFRSQIDAAIAAGVSARLKIIEDAAQTDWRAAAFLLTHCPGQAEHFAKTRIQVEALGQFDHNFTIPQQTLNEIAEARARHEQKQLEGSGAVERK
jgi:hypothetical protein